MNNINPYEYIKDVLDKIVDYPHNKIKELTPIEWKIKQERKEE